MKMAISKMQTERTLLWENTNTSVAFASTTINIDFTPYKYIEIEYVLFSSEGFIGPLVRCKVGGGGALIGISGSSSSISGTLTGGRRNFSTTTSSIYFAGGAACADGGTWFAQDMHGIPYRIWGIK